MKTSESKRKYYFETLKIRQNRLSYWWAGITLPSGMNEMAIDKGGKVVEQYAVM